jgi:hypothetical protein
MDYWLRLWPVLLALFGLMGWAFQLKSDVDTIKDQMGPPGSLPVIQFNIEQLGNRVGKIEESLEKQRDDRERMMDIMRDGQNKIDTLYDVLTRERKNKNNEGKGPEPCW